MPGWLAAGAISTMKSEHSWTRFEQPTTFRLYPGAVELLRTVRELGLTLGIISNWSARLPRVLAAVGIDSWFDFAHHDNANL